MELTHFNEQGRARMVDVSEKAVTFREAVAHGIITMNADDHVPPHIHARYQGHEASFTFDGNLLKGDFPRKQRKLVEAWVLLHAEELEADWELAFNLEHPFRIDPLR